MTKTQQAIAAFMAKDFKKALGIAKTFRAGLTKQDRDTIVRGYECMVHPAMYSSMGMELDVCIAEAQIVFHQKILKPATKETANV